MKQTTRLQILRLFLCAILIGIASGSQAQSIRNEQYISLLNYLNPVYGITFGAPTTLGTNYTFLLPDVAPTSVNQTLVVTSYSGGVFSLGWGGAIGSNSWCLGGNTGTSASTNFIGTTDGVDFVTRTNNSERMRVTSTGKIGIGTSSPTELVEVKNGNLLLSNSSTASQLQFQGTSTGVTTFAAGAQGATTINYTLPTAQGASKTYLQNNGSGALSWVDLSTQIGGIIFARKTSDESVTNSTTLQNDDDLSFAIGANETWEVIIQLEPTSETGDPKLKVALTIPSGTLHVFVSGDHDEHRGDWLKTSGVSNSKGIKCDNHDDDDDSDKCHDNHHDDVVLLQGLIVGGSTGGTVHLQWAPDKSTSHTLTIKTNSYLKATRVQ